ncbi:DUF3768 domain-containing protein [Hyphobacterium sp. WM6]
MVDVGAAARSIPMTNDCKCAQIRALNDEFRTTGQGGKIFITSGLRNRGDGFLERCFQRMREFTDFSEDNDPYSEHDFGSFEIEGETIFWKIDYYDPTMQFASEDASQPEITKRVLTVMLAEEY